MGLPNMIFGDGVGASPVRALIVNSILVFVPLMRRCLGLKTGLQEGSRFTCWGPVLDLRAKETCLKLKLTWPAAAAAGILNWGGPFLRVSFSYVLRSKKEPSLSSCFAQIFQPSRPASRPRGLPRGLPRSLPRSILFWFPWSRDAGARDLRWGLPPTLLQLINFLFGCNFHKPWDLEACLEAVSLRQLRPKILARQHSCQLLQVQQIWEETVEIGCGELRREGETECWMERKPWKVCGEWRSETACWTDGKLWK